MKLDNLLTYLPSEVIARMSLGDPACDIYSVSFLMSDASVEPHEDVLYFADSVLLPTCVPDARQFSCIVVDGEDDPTELSGRQNVNLIWLASGTNLFSCYNDLQTAFFEERELTDVTRRLLNAHFSNEGLQYLIKEASVALGNPIVVVDPAYHYTAYYLGDLPEDESRLARVMSEEIALQSLPEEAVSYIRDSRIDAMIARNKGPYVHHNKILDCTTMTLAVMVHGVCIAHIMMMERNHPFRDLDREAFMRLAGFVGQELQKSEVWGPTSGELGSYFLEALLSDRSPSVAVTRRRLKALNFHPKEQLFVVCLHAPGEGLSQTQVEHVAAQLRPILHHSLYTRHHQQLVILLSRDADEGLSELTIRKLRDVAMLNGLTVGISNAFTDITQVRTAYEQARAAVRYGEQAASSPDDKGIFYYCNYAYMHMIDLAGRRTDLLRLCHPALLRLSAYDEQHSSDLMETLFCYLQMGESTARASKALNLHKNTMLYRLGRIRDILGMDLSSGENVFILQLSFRILTALRLFTPRLHINRAELGVG